MLLLPRPPLFGAVVTPLATRLSSLLGELVAPLSSALPWTRSLAPGIEPRRFPAFGGGELLMVVPAGWHEEIILEPDATAIVLRHAARRDERITVRAIPLTPAECRDFSIETMRQEVDRAARAAGESGIHVFAGRHGGGFFFVRAPSTLNVQVHGRFLTRPIVLEFTIEGRLRRATLEVIRSARAVLHEGSANHTP